jgi:citrate synthase
VQRGLQQPQHDGRAFFHGIPDFKFSESALYPNVDFYSGILLRAIGIPTNMFTVMFAIGRMPGWIAHWKEVRDSGSRIYRPRQLYTGPPARDYANIEWR